MKKSLLFLLLLASFIWGVILARLLPGFLFFWLVILFLFLLGWQWEKKSIILFISLGLVLGWGRWQLAQVAITAGHIADYAGQAVLVQGVVNREVEKRIDRQKITIRAEKIFQNSHWREINGNILVTTALYPEFFYGDAVTIKGRLQPPESFTYLSVGGREIEFAYDDYLKRYDIYSLSYYPVMEKIAAGQGNFCLQQIFAGKELVITKVNRFLPEPQSSFLGGLLWGGKRAMDPELMELFNRTGTTHIVALSGFNITIIGVLVFLLAPWLYLNRRTAVWLSLAVIVLFVIFTGAQASVLRAGIMGSLVLLAYYWGRPRRIFNLLLLAAFLMVLVNPWVLFYDLGFQLSFLATLGLVYLAPLLEKYFRFLPKNLAIRESAVATCSAIIMTGPLIATEFGRLSSGAPLVNILILPAIPPAMLFGFLMVLGTFINYYLALLFSIITWLLLSYIIWLVRFFGSFTWMELPVTLPGWVAGLVYLVYLVIIIWPHRAGIKKISSYLV